MLTASTLLRLFLRNLRGQRTQAEFAALCGLAGNAQVSLMESGDQEIRGRDLDRILAAHGIDVLAFAGELARLARADPETVLAYRARRVRLGRGIRYRLTEEGKRLLALLRRD